MTSPSPFCPIRFDQTAQSVRCERLGIHKREKKYSLLSGLPALAPPLAPVGRPVQIAPCCKLRRRLLLLLAPPMAVARPLSVRPAMPAVAAVRVLALKPVAA